MTVRKLFLIFFLFLSFKNIANNTIDSLFVSLNNSKTRNDSINIIENLFINYNNNEDYINCIKYANIYLNIKDIHYKNKALANKYIAYSYWAMNLKNMSLNYASKSLTQYKFVKDTSGIISVSNLLGILYNNLNKTDKATRFYKKALELSEKVNDKSYQAKIYNNLGSVLINSKEFERAITNYHNASIIMKETSGKNFFAPNLNIAFAYLNLHKVDSAIKYLKIAEKCINNNTENKLAYLLNISEVNIVNKEYDKALKNIFYVIKLAKQKKYNKILLQAYSYLSRIYALKNDYVKALNYQTRFTQISDSLSIINQEMLTTQIALLNKTEKQKILIDKLNIEKKLTKLQLNSYRNKIVLLISGVIIFFIVALIFFIQRNKINRAYKQFVKEDVENLKLKEINKNLEKQINVNNTQTTTEKYKNSTLSDKYKSEIAAKIIFAIEEDKLYKKIDFKINDLAEHIGINRTYISQVFTEEIKIGFKDFINNYRIEYAKKLLSNSNYSNYTIATIAEMAGFNHSSFNRIFKKYTGVTPSFYLKNSK